MSSELSEAYKELYGAAYQYIRELGGDVPDETEARLKAAVEKIGRHKSNPWLAIAERLSSLPTIELSSAQRSLLIDLGVNVWDNGVTEVMNFDNNMTFICKIKTP